MNLFSRIGGGKRKIEEINLYSFAFIAVIGCFGLN